MLLLILVISLSITIHVVDLVVLENDSIENGFLICKLAQYTELLINKVGKVSFDTPDLLIAAELTPQFFATVALFAGCLAFMVLYNPVLTREKLLN